MVETIPSRWMREYFQKVNRELSDWEKATMIWNVPNVTWNDRLDALQELGKKTADSVLQEQIRERITFEQEKIIKLKDNSNGKYVYVVEDADRESFGYFSDYDTAHKKLLNCIEEYEEFNPKYFTIKKQFICDESEYEDYFENCGFEESIVTFDMQGKITYFYTSTDEDLENKWKGRFEEAFFRIPCGMNYCSVKILGDNSYGVVCSTEEKWEAYMDKWNNVGLDFSDIQVLVYSLTENGLWDHQHVNPFFLEPEMPEQIKDDRKRAALIEATIALVKYFEEDIEDNAKKVLETAKKYAAECQKQKIGDVNTIDDIFC